MFQWTPCGPKYYWGLSMLGAKVSVGPKWSWGQTWCEPYS